MSSTLGTIFKVTTFGESHGKSVGAIVDGCPPGITIEEKDIQPQLDRRRPGQSRLTTDRDGSGYSHSAERGQSGPKTGGLCFDADNTTSLPRRLHLPDEIRHSGVERRRQIQRQGNDWQGRSGSNR